MRAAFWLVRRANSPTVMRPELTPSCSIIGTDVPTPGNPASASQTSAPPSFSSSRFATWSVPMVSMEPSDTDCHTEALSWPVRIGGITFAR